MIITCRGTVTLFFAYSSIPILLDIIHNHIQEYKKTDCTKTVYKSRYISVIFKFRVVTSDKSLNLAIKAEYVISSDIK